MPIGAASSLFILYWFQSILVPFSFAVFLMYLIDPVLTVCSKTPRGCYKKFCSCHLSQKSDGTTEPLLGDGGTGGGAEPACPHCRTFVTKTRFPRWAAVVLALAFSLGVVVLATLVIVSSVANLDIQKYEAGAKSAELVAAKYLAFFHLSFANDVYPALITYLQDFVSNFISGFLNFCEQAVISLIFLIYLLVSRVRPKKGVLGKIDKQVQSASSEAARTIPNRSCSPSCVVLHDTCSPHRCDNISGSRLQSASV
jgi:predicted PurR-regulated permease PerM